jgi:hypothetical protein
VARELYKEKQVVAEERASRIDNSPIGSLFYEFAQKVCAAGRASAEPRGRLGAGAGAPPAHRGPSASREAGHACTLRAVWDAGRSDFAATRQALGAFSILYRHAFVPCLYTHLASPHAPTSPHQHIYTLHTHTSHTHIHWHARIHPHIYVKSLSNQYSRPVLGFKEDVEAMGRLEVADFFAK